LQTRDAPFFGLTPLEDQQLAGLFMWIPGGVIYLGCGLALIYAWVWSRHAAAPAAKARLSFVPDDALSPQPGKLNA